MVNADDPVQKYIEMYKNILAFWGFMKKEFCKTVSLSYLFLERVYIAWLAILILPRRNNIPPKVLKDNAGIFITVLSSDINNCILNGIFPSNLKYADIIPVFKKF